MVLIPLALREEFLAPAVADRHICSHYTSGIEPGIENWRQKFLSYFRELNLRSEYPGNEKKFVVFSGIELAIGVWGTKKIVEISGIEPNLRSEERKKNCLTFGI